MHFLNEHSDCNCPKMKLTILFVLSIFVAINLVNSDNLRYRDDESVINVSKEEYDYVVGK